MRLANHLHKILILGPASPRIEVALADARRYAPFGGWALSRNAVQALAHELDLVPEPRICEFGAGVSTVFFSSFLANGGHVDSFESNVDFFGRLGPFINPDRVHLQHRPLRVLTGAEVGALMRGDEEPSAFGKMGRVADEVELTDSRLPNGFYDVGSLNGSYDAVILDGPNGSGRSLAFPLLRDHLKPGALILIDDCTHYPFLADCGRFFSFDIVAGEIQGHDSWILLRVCRINP